MTDEEKTCQQCGVKHKPVFSDAVLAIFDRMVKLEPGPERDRLHYELVEAYAVDHPPTDVETDEPVHELIEELTDARIAYERMVLRLSRMLQRAVPIYRHIHAVPSEIAPPEMTAKPDPKSN